MSEEQTNPADEPTVEEIETPKKKGKPTTDRTVENKEQFFTKHGKLFKLTKAKNFNMKTKDGKILFQEYKKAIADVEIERIKIELDPKVKLQAKIDKQKAAIEAMEEEIKQMGG